MIAEQVGQLFDCKAMNGFVRIRTPMLYPDGDVIDLYFQQNGDPMILTDLGETLRWLDMQTTATSRSLKQNRLIHDIAMTHNIEVYGGRLLTRVASLEALSSETMRLAQAALRVSDLSLTFRNQTFSSTTDEVQDFLIEQGVEHQRNVPIIGRSTRPWRVDFHALYPKRSAFIAVLSGGSRAAGQTLTNAVLAQWIDLASYKVSQQVQFISLFDDSVDIWQESDFRQLEDYSEIVYWSRPDNLLEAITRP